MLRGGPQRDKKEVVRVSLVLCYWAAWHLALQELGLAEEIGLWDDKMLGSEATSGYSA